VCFVLGNIVSKDCPVRTNQLSTVQLRAFQSCVPGQAQPFPSIMKEGDIMPSIMNANPTTRRARPLGKISVRPASAHVRFSSSSKNTTNENKVPNKPVVPTRAKTSLDSARPRPKSASYLPKREFGGPVVVSVKQLAQIRRRATRNADALSDSLEQATLREMKRKERLKGMSRAHTEKFPNTLEATRLKKNAALRTRLEDEENARKEIDRQEAEYQRQERKKKIQRAKDMLYDQTDRMKILRSKRLYCNVLHTRKEQIEGKMNSAEKEKELENKYHSRTMADVEKWKEEESAVIVRRNEAIDRMKADRKQQVDEILAARAKEEAEAIAIGVSLRARAEEDASMEALSKVEKQKLIALKAEENLRSNAKLLLVKEHQKIENEKYEQRLAGELQEIERRNNKQKALDKERIEKAHKARQKMIDDAVQQLSKVEQANRELFDRQVAEREAKMAKEEADKRSKKEKLWKEIVQSRAEQLADKKSKTLVEWEENQSLAETQKKLKEQQDIKEAEKEKRKQEFNDKIKLAQLAEAQQKAKKKIDDRVVKITTDKLMFANEGEDDAKFLGIVKQDIKINLEQKKPVYPLLTMLDFKPPEIIPAIRDPTKRRQVKQLFGYVDSGSKAGIAQESAQ
jgi:hypothetical protein